MRILIQLPEGLKRNAIAIAERLEKQGNEVIISSSPCYGACDLALEEARRLGADKIIHYGHSDYGVRSEIPVEYVEFEMKVKFRGVLGRSLKLLGGYKRIGLVTTVQHVGQLQEIKKFLERHGKKVFIGKPSGHAKHPGQILGCDIGSAKSIESKVDCFVYFGGGIFHPLGAALGTEKPFLAVDPFTNKIQFMDEERKRSRKRRMGALLRAIDAKEFGIICSTKPGQWNFKLAVDIKKKLEAAGKSAHILVSNELDFESLGNFVNFDCFVDTACPRIALDDFERTSKPVLGMGEFEELVRLLKTEKGC